VKYQIQLVPVLFINDGTVFESVTYYFRLTLLFKDLWSLRFCLSVCF